MAQITTLDTVSKLLKYVTITLPPFVTKSDDSYIRQFLSSILEVFKINIDQLNQMFNNTFISEAEEGDLEKLILDVSNVTRKDGETDEDYRNRFYKYVYRYNATANSIEEIVYDTLGYYPIKLTESGARTAYWGLHDLVEEDRVANSAYFYDDVNEYTAYWGRYQSQQSSENEKYFVGIIHLVERPPQEKLDELCDVIERVRKKGTKIYLQFLDNIDIILEPIVTIVEENAFTFTWRLVPSAFSYEIQIDDDPLFGSPTTYITSSTSYNFSGLSGGVTYYTRVRYENDDGYSEWTEPVETTTPSSIGTPIATEETNVSAYGFTANWGSASGATSYLLTISLNSDLSSPISGFNEFDVGGVVNYIAVSSLDIQENEVLYYGIKATNGISTSPYSNIITVNKPIGDLQRDLYTQATYLFNNNYNNLEGINPITPINSPTFSTPLLNGDGYSLLLDGSNDLLQIPNVVSTTRDITIRELSTYQSFTRAYTLGYYEYYTQAVNTNYVGKIGIEYDKNINKFYIILYDESFSSVNQFNYAVLRSDTVELNINTKYLFQFSWNNTTKTALLCVNGVSYTLSQISGSTPIASLNLSDSINPNNIYYGAYTNYGSVDTTYSPNKKLARLFTDSISRNLSYHRQDWINIISRILQNKNLTTTANTKQYLVYQEGTGTTTIDQINSNDAILMNGTTWIAGAYSDNSAISLDGVNDYIYSNDDNSLDITADLTLEEIFEIGSSTINNTNVILMKGNTAIMGEVSYQIQYRGGDSPKRFIIELYDVGGGGSGYTNILFDATLTANTKYKVTFTWNNTTKTPKLYLNKTELTAYQNIPWSGGITYGSISNIRVTTAKVLRGRYEESSTFGASEIKYYRSAIHAEVKSKTISDNDCDTFGLT